MSKKQQDPAQKPLAQRDAIEILKAVLDLAWVIRLATVPLFYVCDRAPLRRRGRPSIYVDRALPLREAVELLTGMLEMRATADPWRWRLCLCPVDEVTRAGIYVLLMDPPTRERPWSEPRWMRAATADERPRVIAIETDDGGADGPEKTDGRTNGGGPRSVSRRRLTSAQGGSTDDGDGSSHERDNDRRGVRRAASSGGTRRPKKCGSAQMELCFGDTVGAEIG